MDRTWKESCEQLTKEAYEEVRRGNFRTAFHLFSLAHKLAESAGDQLEIDRSVCNLSTAELSLGNFHAAEQGLREILLRCSDHELLFIASAAVPPEEIYPEGDGAWEFHRTLSRLCEMQSEDYIANRATP